MKVKEAINWLETKPRFKEKVSLDKMKNALKILDHPEKNFKAIHITGTNGKGSVAKFLSNTLKTNYKVGLFTSPYIVKFNERIQINNEFIKDEDLLEYILWAKDFDDKYFSKYQDNFSFFELLTLIAIKYFNDQNVDYAIIEAGIGGKLDSTNVIDSKISVITSVGIDHVDQLGETLEEILEQKLGIVKEEGVLFTAIKDFNDVIDNTILNKNAKVKYITNNFEIINEYPLEFKYNDLTYKPNLQGLYQINNAMLAIEVLKYLNQDKKVIIKGINETINPGRFEIIKTNPTIILDGAHNFEAIKKLTESLKLMFPNKKINILFTAMGDKPYIKMVKRLKETTPYVYLTQLTLPRALKNFNEDVFKGLKVYEKPLEAFLTIKETLDVDDILVITGSMYLVSEIRNYILNNK